MIWKTLKAYFLPSKQTSFEKALNYKFKDKKWLHQALTHRSVSRHKNHNNERLEYLGDAVLNLVLGDALMQAHPSAQEGVLSKMRSSLVSTKGLNKKAQELNIQNLLYLYGGHKMRGFQNNMRLMASFFEAIIGAIYLDTGYTKVQKVILHLFQKDLKQKWVDEDYKTLLQEKTHKLFQQIPEYEVIEEKGPTHKKTFVIQVKVNQEVLGVGQGFTKKKAEQEASEQALKKLNSHPPTKDDHE